jgi:hypothetical protein
MGGVEQVVQDLQDCRSTGPGLRQRRLDLILLRIVSAPEPR